MEMSESVLVWLDPSVNGSDDNIEAQGLLRKAHKNVEIFEEMRECENFLRKQSETTKITLIISGSLGRQLVPRIVNLAQIEKIYVFCFDEKANEIWAKDYAKIRLVTKNFQLILNALSSIETVTVERGGFHDDPVTVPVAPTNPTERRTETAFTFSITHRSTGALDGTFLYWQILIDVLLRIKPSEREREKFGKVMAPLAKNDPEAMRAIDEFVQSYQPEKAAWWYTRDSCVYRILNEGLRQQNPHVLFYMRFFIQDLQKQLANHQCRTALRVYRSQSMSKDEIDTLQKSKNKWISINSFLSTSTSEKVAKHFLRKTESLELVLFEIDARPESVSRKPFAQIKDLSYFQFEDEVLFMLGSIFQIDDIRQDADGVWNIKLTQCSDSDHQLKQLYEDINEELCKGEITVWTFTDVLRRMGRIKDAEFIGQLLRQSTPQDHLNVGEYYVHLGRLLHDKGDYRGSLDAFERALELYEKAQNRSAIADTYTDIAKVYFDQGDYEQSRKKFDQALTLYKQLYGDQHRTIATCYDGIGACYGKTNEHFDALYFKSNALIIREKYLPKDHADLGQSHMCIGTTHICLEQYSSAMDHFEYSLAIYDKSLPHEHPRVAATLKHIGIAQEKQKCWTQALEAYQKAEQIYRRSLPTNHADLLDIEAKIRNVAAKTSL